MYRSTICAIILLIAVLLLNSHLNTYYSGIPCTVVKTSDVRYDPNMESWMMTVTVDIHGGRYIDHEFSSNVYNVSTTSDTILQPGTTMSCISEDTLLRSNKVIILDPADISPYYYYLGVVDRMLIFPILVVIILPCLLYPLNI